MIIRVSNHDDRIRLIAIATMKGAFGNEGALRFLFLYCKEFSVMRRSNRDLEREALELEQRRVVHELFEFDFIGDDLFSIGVPALLPSQFRKMVFGAAKTYVLGNASVDHTIRTYGANWNFEPPRRGYYPLYREICYFVTSHINREVQRFLAIRRTNNHHGFFAARSALLRLQTSFRVACLLLRQHAWVELACILKLIVEQIAWSYAVRDLEGDALFWMAPTKAIGLVKAFCPNAPKVYGLLNETSHMSPEQTVEYLEFSTRHPGVYLTSARHTAKCAYFLLLLLDMYLLVSEYVHHGYYRSRYVSVDRKKGEVLTKPNKKLVLKIQSFRKRLIAVQKKNPLR